jgi:hypothetical protein
LEAAFSGCGLRITLRGTTASLPDSTHWHLKRGNLAGTLEATLSPKQNRLWLSVQDERRASWIEDALPEFAAALERACKANE